MSLVGVGAGTPSHFSGAAGGRHSAPPVANPTQTLNIDANFLRLPMWSAGAHKSDAPFSKTIVAGDGGLFRMACLAGAPPSRVDALVLYCLIEMAFTQGNEAYVRTNLRNLAVACGMPKNAKSFERILQALRTWSGMHYAYDNGLYDHRLARHRSASFHVCSHQVAGMDLEMSFDAAWFTFLRESQVTRTMDLGLFRALRMEVSGRLYELMLAEIPDGGRWAVPLEALCGLSMVNDSQHFRTKVQEAVSQLNARGFPCDAEFATPARGVCFVTFSVPEKPKAHLNLPAVKAGMPTTLPLLTKAELPEISCITIFPELVREEQPVKVAEKQVPAPVAAPTLPFVVQSAAPEQEPEAAPSVDLEEGVISPEQDLLGEKCLAEQGPVMHRPSLPVFSGDAWSNILTKLPSTSIGKQSTRDLNLFRKRVFDAKGPEWTDALLDFVLDRSPLNFWPYFWRVFADRKDGNPPFTFDAPQRTGHAPRKGWKAPAATQGGADMDQTLVQTIGKLPTGPGRHMAKERGLDYDEVMRTFTKNTQSSENP